MAPRYVRPVRETLRADRAEPDKTSGRLRRHGALVALLLGTAAFRMTQNMALTTLSLLAHHSVHLGAGAIGSLGAISGIVVAFVTLVLSRRIPHHRAALSAAGGMGLLTLALIVLAVASSFGVLLVGVVLLAVAGGLTMTGLLNAIVTEAGRRRERVIAIYTVTLSLSLAVGPLLETFVLSLAREAVRAPYVAFAVFPLLGAVLALLASRQQRGAREAAERARQEGGEEIEEEVPGERLVIEVSSDEVVALGSHKESSGPLPGAPPTRRWSGGLLSTRAGQMALVTELLYGVPFAGITVFGALVAHVGFGFSPARVQLGFTVFFVLSLLARAVVAFKAPIIHKKALLTLAALLTTAGLALLGLGHGALELFLAMGLLGIPHGLTFPLSLALIAESTPAAGLPRANATLLGSGNLLSVVVPLVLGGIIPEIGYQKMTLVMLGPVVALTAVHLALRKAPAS